MHALLLLLLVCVPALAKDKTLEAGQPPGGKKTPEVKKPGGGKPIATEGGRQGGDPSAMPPPKQGEEPNVSGPATVVDAYNGGASTLGEYQSLLPRLLQEQRRAQTAAKEFAQVAERLAAEHKATARNFDEFKNQAAQSRERLDTSSPVPMALPGISGMPVRGAENGRASGIVPSEARSPAQKPAKELGVAKLDPSLPAKPARGPAMERVDGQSTVSAASDVKAVASSGASRSGIDIEREKSDLKKRLAAQAAARKRERGEKLTREETTLLKEMEGTATGTIADLVAAAEQRSEFAMLGSETDAAVRALASEKEWSERAPEVLSQNSEELFERVRSAHKRSVLRGAIKLFAKRKST